jgi:hypothetical protein
MTAKWFICKQASGSAPCGAKFHPDDKEDYVEHLAAHGVDTSALAPVQWWDEEGGFSISPEDRVTKGTPLTRSQFGDGSDAQRRENGRKWHDLRALEAVSTHDTPAAKFIGAKVIAEGRGADVNPPKVGVPLAKVTSSPPSAVVEGVAADVQRTQESRTTVSSRKGATDMTTATKSKKTEENPYADAPVVNLTVGAGADSAPRVCITTGQGFTDVKAIESIMTLLQKTHPNAVVTNQGRWAGDQIVANVARSIGLGYEMTLPKFLEARRRGTPLFTENHRMTPEENGEVGYLELQDRIAANCIELHVFGAPSGPQRGLIEAFNDVAKHCFSWGSSTD